MQSLILGDTATYSDDSHASHCFFFCSDFCVQRIILVRKGIDLPSLHTLMIGAKSFFRCRRSVFRGILWEALQVDLKSLTVFHVGHSAFYGVWEQDQPMSECSIINAPMLSRVDFSNYAFFNVRKLIVESEEWPNCPFIDCTSLNEESSVVIARKALYTLQSVTVTCGTASLLVQQLKEKKLALNVDVI